MTPDKERLLQERCAAFKGIRSQERFYIFLQCALDFVLLSGAALMLTVSAHLYPMLIFGVILVKLALVFLLKGNKGNLAGLAVTLLYFPLMAHFEALDAPTVGMIALIIMMHLFRIIPCTAAQRISGLYGAPGFNGFILADELGRDEKLAATVLGSYNDVSEDMAVGLTVREMSLHRAVRLMKPAGALLLVGGICMLISAHSLKAGINDAENAAIGEKTAGKTVAVVTDRIYRQSGEGSFDSYWCRVGGQAVHVNVYDDESKEKFRELCVYFEASTEAETAWLSGNDVGASSDEPVRFAAEVKQYTKYSALKPSERSKEYIDDGAEIVEEYYLDVIDPHKADRLSGSGMILTMIGAALLGVFCTMFFVSKGNIQTL